MAPLSEDEIVDGFRLLNLEKKEERDRLLSRMENLRSEVTKGKTRYVLVSQEWETGQ